MPVQTLLITGTVSVGKSTIAAQINDTLAALKVPNAAIDLDALSWQWPPSSKWNDDLMFENLAALWPNYVARGVTHLVLARVLEDRADLDRYRAAIPGADITVCRLVAPEADRIARLLGRMPPGPSREWHLARTVELNSILERLAVEDFVVDNGVRPVREVASEILVRTGWLSHTNRPTTLPSQRADETPTTSVATLNRQHDPHPYEAEAALKHGRAWR